MAISLIAMGALPAAAATHMSGCTPGAADPSTYTVVDFPDGRRWYIEERPMIDPGRPIPFSGFLLGSQTYTYQEDNGVPGLQRGFAGLGPCLPPEPLCVIPPYDSVNDANCGHGEDAVMLPLQSPL